MKNTWKYSLVLCSLLLPLSCGARADSLATLNLTISPSTCGGAAVGGNFSFAANRSGGSGANCTSAFTNASGFDWTGLQVHTIIPGTVAIPVDPCNNPLLSFSSSVLESNACGFDAQTRSLTLSFSGVGLVFTDFGPKFYTGIPVGAGFLVDLGASGWGVNEQFDAVAAGTSVPEPGTWAMLGLGLLAIARRRTKVLPA